MTGSIYQHEEGKYPLIDEALKRERLAKLAVDIAVSETFKPGTKIQWKTMRGCWITEYVTRTEGVNVYFTKGGEGEQPIHRHYTRIRLVEE